VAENELLELNLLSEILLKNPELMSMLGGDGVG
jgi:hypothetical protein